jgi:chaperonin GroES
MSHPKIQPIGDRILIQYSKSKEQKAGDLFIPDSAQEKSQEATVIALGRGRLMKDGTLVPFEVKVGETILVAKYGGSDVKLDEQKYSLVREEDILGVLA